jgi:hypothetical protein
VSPRLSDAERESLQSRYALRVTSSLNRTPLPHDIEERLRVSRDLAGSRARAARAKTASQVAAAREVSVFEGGQAALRGFDGGTPRWVPAALGAVVLALVCGLWAIDVRNDMLQLDSAAEIDAALLADDLPPKAYSDVGFREYLRSAQD